MLKTKLDIRLGIQLGIPLIIDSFNIYMSWAYLFDGGKLVILILRFLGELRFMMFY